MGRVRQNIMIDKINSQSNIQSMLQTIRSYQEQASGGIDTDSNKLGGFNGLDRVQTPTAPTGFGDLIRQSIDKVNDTQQKALEVAASYERGEGVPLTDVVLGMQKSSLSFEATLQVRNKVLKAYEDILNMPV